MDKNWIKWAEDVHNTAYEQLSETRETMVTKSPEELGDIGWVLKKMYENVDSLRKEIDKLKGSVERLACLKAISEDKVKLHGKLANTKPDCKVSARLPHPEKKPEEWKALCDFFGVPSEIGELDLMRFHWPGLSAFITERSAHGKPNPPGITPDTITTHYYLTYRGKK